MANGHTKTRSPELLDAMAAAYEQRGGRLVKDVAADFGETPSAFRHVLERVGKLKTNGRAERCTDAEREQVRSLWSLKTIVEIARDIGRDPDTVSQWAKAMGLPTKARTVTAADDAAIRQAILCGQTRKQTCVKLKIGAERWRAAREALIAEGLVAERVDPTARNAEIARLLRDQRPTAAICEALEVRPNVVWAVAKAEGPSIKRKGNKVRTSGSRPSPLILGPRASLGPKPPTREAYVTAPADARQLVHLSAADCRWPYGEGESIVFCGHRAERGPYCQEHKRRAVA